MRACNVTYNGSIAMTQATQPKCRTEHNTLMRLMINYTYLELKVGKFWENYS